MNEQDKFSGKELNKSKTRNLIDKEFKSMAIKMFTTQREEWMTQ